MGTNSSAVKQEPEEHGHNAYLNIPIRINRTLSTSVVITTNQNQKFCQSLQGWKRTILETFLVKL